MRCIHVAVVVFSLLSGGQSAPVTGCETLTQPIEIKGRDQLLGKWMFVAESTNIIGSKLLTKMFVESAWARISAANESDAITVFQAQKMFDRCYSLTAKMTLENSTLSMVQPYIVSEVLLNTGCPDCLVVYSKYTGGRNVHSGLQLLSRRNAVTAAELEEFKKQVECLNLPPPAIMDPGNDACPDESPSQETEITDLTHFISSAGFDVFDLIDRITSSQSGLNGLFQVLSSGVTGFKEN